MTLVQLYRSLKRGYRHLQRRRFRRLLAIATCTCLILSLVAIPAIAVGFQYPFEYEQPITSGYGPRASPGGIGSTNHQGIDFGAPLGTPILSVAKGVVVYAGWYGGYGNTVIVKHGELGIETLYAHMDAIYARDGEVVESGSTLGTVGTTGTSTGDHLHFGVYDLATQDVIDPTSYIASATLGRPSQIVAQEPVPLVFDTELDGSIDCDLVFYGECTPSGSTTTPDPMPPGSSATSQPYIVDFLPPPCDEVLFGYCY